MFMSRNNKQEENLYELAILDKYEHKQEHEC
jgi:hypothetical protein